MRLGDAAVSARIVDNTDPKIDLLMRPDLSRKYGVPGSPKASHESTNEYLAIRGAMHEVKKTSQ